jgi:hypothetical protein
MLYVGSWSVQTVFFLTPFSQPRIAILTVLCVYFFVLKIYLWWECITDWFWHRCLIYYGDTLLREVSSDAFGPNWVWRKELFLTSIISEGIFLLLKWVPSQRSQIRRFRIELSLVERIVSFFLIKRKSLIGITITEARCSQRSWTKKILTGILSGV